MTDPLDSIEREIFYQATLEHVEAEFKIRGGEAALSGYLTASE